MHGRDVVRFTFSVPDDFVFKKAERHSKLCGMGSINRKNNNTVRLYHSLCGNDKQMIQAESKSVNFIHIFERKSAYNELGHKFARFSFIIISILFFPGLYRVSRITLWQIVAPVVLITQPN